MQSGLFGSRPGEGQRVQGRQVSLWGAEVTLHCKCYRGVGVLQVQSGLFGSDLEKVSEYGADKYVGVAPICPAVLGTPLRLAAGVQVKQPHLLSVTSTLLTLL